MAEHNGGGFVWFLAGLGLGAAVGVLYAPKAGRETRDALRSSADEGREYVTDRAQRAREQANTWAEKSRETLNQQKEHVRSAYDAGRQAYREVTSTPEPTKQS